MDNLINYDIDVDFEDNHSMIPKNFCCDEEHCPLCCGTTYNPSFSKCIGCPYHDSCLGV